MSTALALAGVTYVLRDLLNDGLINNTLDTSVRVTARPPVRDPSISTAQESQLNVFLYHVSPNTGWRNAALPSRDSSGVRASNPPLALNLHYLITAYDERDYHAEVVLGYAMQLLHENPGLSRDQIRKSLKSDIVYDPGTEPQLPTELKRLTQTGLADQVESLTITPRYLNTEEMSKLWTGLQAPYRPSMAYEVSVVLIEREITVASPLPVQTRNLQVAPFAFVVLEEVSPPRAVEGGTLALRGVTLSRPGLQVSFAGRKVPPEKVVAGRLDVKIPVGLRSGVNAVSVTCDINFGVAASDPHGGIESNSLAFLLLPSVAPVGATAFRAAPGGELSVAVTPRIAADQKVQLLLGATIALSLATREPDSEPLADVKFTIPATFETGEKYLLRLRVDGVDSALTWEPNPAEPTQGKFTGPFLTIT